MSPEVQQYFDDRMKQLGVTPELNKVNLWQTETDGIKPVLTEFPLFKPVEKGIEIMVYTLDRYPINYAKEGSRWKNKFYTLIRLQQPIEKNGQVQKYMIPKGQGTYPFFPPALVEKYEQKQQFDTLFLVEGFFKAWKADNAGANIVGLSSITHMKDKEKGTLHPDIFKLLKTCGIKRMVWLTDGDALDITNKELTDGIDLYRRPRNFFNSVTTFKTLLDDYDGIEKWFFHIDTDNILLSHKNLTRDQVKGIDDLLVTLPGENAEIIMDMYSVSVGGDYFQKMNITWGTNKVHKHFHLSNVTEFYLFHVERRKDLKDKEFIYNGTRYKYSEEKNECIIMVPGEAKNYFRVGDQYYKYFNRPNKYEQLEQTFAGRQKGTITDDHGKNFTTHIPKYEAFCNVPNHVNYQKVIHGNFNLYSPLDYQPDENECTEEDCPTIIGFMQHIFGRGPVHYRNPKSGKELNTEYYQLGLDFVQLLYSKPSQKLPILCLVSKENETGKSTFAMLLKNIFTSNAAIVGNADLADNFNAHWASKLLVVCDETKIDKQAVVERVKSLSTADKIMMNAKGKDQVELDFFAKFMFLTNNEDNFIYASEEDLRYWVIKVPKILEKNPDLMEQMVEEIPAFLAYLNRRQLATDKMTRMWFDPALLKTDALRKVIQYSQPSVEKEIRSFLKDMFIDFGLDEIMMTRKAIHQEVFNNRFEANYIERVIKENLKARTFYKWQTPDGKLHDTEEAAKLVLSITRPGLNEMELLAMIKPYDTVTRYSYPKWHKKLGDATWETVRVDVQDRGRPYVFKRSDYISDEEWSLLKLDAEQVSLNTLIGPLPTTPAPIAAANKTPDEADLPF